MRVIAVKTLRDFSAKHPSAKQSLLAWHDEACKANWQTPADIKRHFASASFLSENRVVFNIKGNDFRLITSIAYRLGVVYIKFVGTHAQYDAVDATTVDMN
jgi:mRNA interferase HigB